MILYNNICVVSNFCFEKFNIQRYVFSEIERPPLNKDIIVSPPFSFAAVSSIDVAIWYMQKTCNFFSLWLYYPKPKLKVSEASGVLVSCLSALLSSDTFSTKFSIGYTFLLTNLTATSNFWRISHMKAITEIVPTKMILFTLHRISWWTHTVLLRSSRICRSVCYIFEYSTITFV